MAVSTGVASLLVAILFASFQPPSVVKAVIVTDGGSMVLSDGLELVVGLEPPQLDALPVSQEQRVYFNVTIASYGNRARFELEGNAIASDTSAPKDDIVIHVESEQQENAVVIGVSDFHLLDIISRNTDLNLESNLTYGDREPLFFTVRGAFLGYTRIRFYTNGSVNVSSVSSNGEAVEGMVKPITDDETTDRLQEVSGPNRTLLPIEYDVAVIREPRIVDHVFIVVVAILVLFSNMGMGCKVDLAVVKEIFKKPIAPTIGFCCQYIIMPLASFAALTFMKLEGGVALGLFAAGCAPGGSGSNMYTYLLDGDVSLSVTMTFISTLASLFMIPAWLYSLGRLITSQDTRLKVPITNILISLFSLLVPVAIGILIRRKRPQLARSIDKVLRPFFLVLIVFMFTFGVWVNLYIFRLMTLPLCLAGAFLPYAGFLFGGLVAGLCRQPLARALTIAIETGLQNTGIPILLLKFSLPQPSADMSVVSPVTTSIFTPVPLFIMVVVHEVRRRRCRGKAPELNAVNGDAHTPCDVDVDDDDGGGGQDVANGDPVLDVTQKLTFDITDPEVKKN